MTAIHWLNPISNSFTNASDWSGGVVPGAADDAIIDAVGASPYTVTVSAAATVNSLQTGAQATVSISHATFTAGEGTGEGANAGIILIGAGATFAASGTVDNTGLIKLGPGRGADALVAEGSLTLTGGGRVFMSDSKRNRISGSKRDSFTNFDNTIFGSGTIGGAKYFGVTNSAHGVVDATGAVELDIVSPIHNNGLLEATGKGGLHVSTQIQNGSTGKVLANNSNVWLDSATVYGGILDTVGSGTINLRQGTLRGVTNDGNVTVSAYSTWLDGLVNHGTITAGVSGINTRFLGETLSGGGHVAVFGAVLGVSLNVDNTITGSGIVQAVNGEPGLVNGALGVIEANASAALRLFSTTISNAGLLESDGVGGSGAYLRLDATEVVNTGTILSASAVAPLTIQAKSLDNAGLISSTGLGGVALTEPVVNAGVLSVSGGGTMSVSGKVSGGGHALVDDATLIFSSTFSQDVTFTGSSGQLELALSETFAKTITGFSSTGATSFDLGDISFVSPGEATFSGDKHGGVLTITDGVYTARIDLKGDYRHTPFVASSDGNHGTIIVAGAMPQAPALDAPPSQAPMTPTVHAFVGAMAGFGVTAGQGVHTAEAWSRREPILISPRLALA